MPRELDPDARGAVSPVQPTTDDVRVVLLTRAGCHLCLDAEATVTGVCGDLGVRYRVTDVDADPALRAEHTDHVPVTFVDGVRFAIWFLDADALRATLA